ncbi:MAG: hypothetical protein D6736_06935, partial [Nitrospinota bacterium]
ALSRVRIDGRWFLILALVGMAVDARFLDLSLPGLPGGWARSLLTLLLGLGLCLTLPQKSRGLVRRVIVVMIPIFVLAGLGFVLPYREAHRYVQYQSAQEVHSSQHVLFAPVARFLQKKYPGKPLAVAASGSLEFLYLFVGPRFERRVLYVETHDGPPSTGPNPTGNPRFAFDREAWIQNMAKTQVELLLLLRWREFEAWPPEYSWAIELGFPLLYQDRHSSLFAVQLSEGSRISQAKEF